MDYVDGENLSTCLKRTNAPLPEHTVLNYLNQILDGLQAVHAAGMLHLDIKPANIMVDKNGVVKLIDFGASKQQSAADGVTTTTGIYYTNGYAPSEQMAQNYAKFGPWTDFYALGATLYKLLTNQDPPSVSDVMEDTTDDKHIALPMPNVSNKTKRLIVYMLAENRLKRPQNVESIKACINSTADETTIFIAKSPKPIRDTNVSDSDNVKSENGNNTFIYIIIAVVVVGLFFVLMFSVRGCNNSKVVPNVAVADSDTIATPDTIMDTVCIPENTSVEEQKPQAYIGTDVGTLINLFLTQCDGGKYMADFGIFSDNSMLSGSDVDVDQLNTDYGMIGYAYYGKLTSSGTYLTNAPNRMCSILLQGPRAGADIMVVNCGEINDNLQDSFRSSISSGVGGRLLSKSKGYSTYNYLYKCPNGYVLFNFTLGASAEFMTIYATASKSTMTDIMNQQ